MVDNEVIEHVAGLLVAELDSSPSVYVDTQFGIDEAIIDGQVDLIAVVRALAEAGYIALPPAFTGTLVGAGLGWVDDETGKFVDSPFIEVSVSREVATSFTLGRHRVAATIYDQTTGERIGG